VKVISCNEYGPEWRVKRKHQMQKKCIESVIVEQPSGNIKCTEFIARGLSKIEVKKDLLNSVSNLKLIWDKMLKTTTRITRIFQKVNFKNSKASTYSLKKK